jgi:alkylation response protein AidB-like acyl-CoA dehydrogenase
VHAHEAVQIVRRELRLALRQRAQGPDRKAQPLVRAAHSGIIGHGTPSARARCAALCARIASIVSAFERTAEYVQNYVQGGRILIKHQAVAIRLAEMATRLHAVRGMLREASRAVDEDSPDADYLCSMTKLFASEEILKVCQHAMELHGGNGIMLDFGIEKFFRDAAVFLHMDGTVNITKFKIVKAMFPDTAGSYAGPE